MRLLPGSTLSGVVAAAVLLLAVLLLRLATGARSVIEIVADGVLSTLPGAFGSAVIDTLQGAAKWVLYGGVALGALLVGAVLGRVYAERPSWQRLVILVGAVWLVFGVLVYPIAGGGPFGARFEAGAMWHAVSLLALVALFGLVLAGAHRWLMRPSYAPRHLSRRELLRAVGALGVVGLGTALAWRFAAPSAPAQPQAAGVSASGNAPPFDIAGLAREVTSNDDFYTVSKNMFDPVVESSTWKLRIGGLVERPFELTYAELRALPAVERYHTLLCISNEVGGDLMGNALWKGVLVRDLLERAGPKPGIRDAACAAADDYTDSVAFERVMHPNALLVYEMNGQPLPREHGFPARLLVPDIYGMKNVKWLTEITLVAEDVKGFWQTQGWDDSAHYQVMSRIDVPVARTRVTDERLSVAGVAFAGERGIVRVELSADGGVGWTDAQLKPQLAFHTWQLWRADLNLPANVRDIRVRASDSHGTLQTERQAAPFPAGSTGWHTLRLARDP